MTKAKTTRMPYVVLMTTFTDGNDYPTSRDELIARFATNGDAAIFADARAHLPMPTGTYLRFSIEKPSACYRRRLVSVHG